MMNSEYGMGIRNQEWSEWNEEYSQFLIPIPNSLFQIPHSCPVLLRLVFLGWRRPRENRRSLDDHLDPAVELPVLGRQRLPGGVAVTQQLLAPRGDLRVALLQGLAHDGERRLPGAEQFLRRLL